MQLSIDPLCLTANETIELSLLYSLNSAAIAMDPIEGSLQLDDNIASGLPFGRQ
ncbi:hypothetical protein CHELA1G11_12735 [Hyphomicrobiales bacterium]|nr:hypothetical protein CHELA1G2_11572 [Hyphomicrobiales bacterium]CAH1666758.1 hypothetical protein CHELA1G11_12735 [Hyphomicrobiales bacterium]